MQKQDDLDECLKIIYDLQHGTTPPTECWSKLASYYASRGDTESAQWCSTMASGKSYHQADEQLQHNSVRM